MKAKYWLCKRKEIFFSFDSTTGKRESLHTGDREAAKQIISQSRMVLWPRFNKVERTCQTPSCDVQISFSGEGMTLAGFSNCFLNSPNE